MKKLTIFLLVLCFFSVESYAYEYSSKDAHEGHDWYDKDFLPNEKKSYSDRRNPQQNLPIQIYIAPQNSYFNERNSHSHRHYKNSEQYREERYWRERREELQQMPQTPYYENQFDRDDTHW